MEKSEHPAGDFLRPKLKKLLDEAVKAGFVRDVAIAVLLDMLESDGEEEAGPR